MEQLQWEMYELRKSNASLLGNADTNAQLRRGSSSSTRTSKLKLLKKELQCCLCYDKQADTFLYRLKLAWLSFYLLLFHTSYLIENLRGYSSKMVLSIKIPLDSLLNEFFTRIEFPPYTENFSWDPDSDLFCCCILLPSLNYRGIDSQPIDI
ncbi:uncharacterized protein [Euphorbia lathyris]|uniref:uncharacterized protein isoform X2 n=1 Tax=Euphorbia lathyris TaxID=212925 RepID=UPI00331421D0